MVYMQSRKITTAALVIALSFGVQAAAEEAYDAAAESTNNYDAANTQAGYVDSNAQGGYVDTNAQGGYVDANAQGGYSDGVMANPADTMAGAMDDAAANMQYAMEDAAIGMQDAMANSAGTIAAGAGDAVEGAVGAMMGIDMYDSGSSVEVYTTESATTQDAGMPQGGSGAPAPDGAQPAEMRHEPAPAPSDGPKDAPKDGPKDAPKPPEGEPRGIGGMKGSGGHGAPKFPGFRVPGGHGHGVPGFSVPGGSGPRPGGGHGHGGHGPGHGGMRHGSDGEHSHGPFKPDK